jgi:hypothetical protein
MLERGLGVDSALAALLCAVVVGLCVRHLLGGVSRTAGVIAAGLCVAAAAAGSAWAGAVGTGAGAAAMRPVSDWVLAHGPAAAALYAVAAGLAYAAAAGHRAV